MGLKQIVENPFFDCRMTRETSNRTTITRSQDIQIRKPSVVKPTARKSTERKSIEHKSTELKSNNMGKRKKELEPETPEKPTKKPKTIANQQHGAFAAQDLENVVFYDIDREECGECNRKMGVAGHFTSYLCCTKCRYSTCCSRAITSHVNTFHGIKKSQNDYNLGSPVVLDSAMYCVCGFNTLSGMKLAKHLASSKCSTAYSNKESAEKAKKSSQEYTEEKEDDDRRENDTTKTEAIDNKIDSRSLDGEKVGGDKTDGEKMDDEKIDGEKIDAAKIDAVQIETSNFESVKRDGEKTDDEEVDDEKVDEKIDAVKI